MVACSSSGSGGNGGGAGTSDAGAGTGAGGGGGGPSPCDHVIVADQDLTFGFGAALAVDGSDLFVLRDVDTRRSVQALKAAKLVEVAGVDDEPTIYMGGSTLVANANGFFFDATAGGKRAIYRAPRAGGTASLWFELSDDAGSLAPPFVADGAYLYARAAAPSNDSLARIPASGDAGSSLAAIGGAFGGASSYSMVATGDWVLLASGSAELRAARSAASDASPSAVAVADFNLTGCSADLGSTLAAGDAGLFLGCVGADLSFHAIYRVPPPSAWSTASTSGQATEVVSGSSINHAAFLVSGTNVYYSNEAEPALYRVSSDGGAKTKIMATHGVKHLAATGTDVYVLSACGLQQAGL